MRRWWQWFRRQLPWPLAVAALVVALPLCQCLRLAAAALEDRLNARITYSQLATIIILTAVMGAFNIWG